MEPGHEDREYRSMMRAIMRPRRASMEPGHEDREYQDPRRVGDTTGRPQWSPVMKTGNTRRTRTLWSGVSGLNGARS